jgi:ribosomal protein S18
MTETEMNKEELNSSASSEFKRCDNSKKSVAEIFAERKQKYKRDQMKTLPLSDQLDYRNPQVLSEFSTQIYQTMLKDEVKHMVDPNYLQKVQTEIKDTSRAFLIEWIIDVHRKFRLTPECLYVAIYIIDQFMSKKKI